MRRVAGPTGLADHHVEAKRREIVSVSVDAGVFRFVEDLGVGPAFIAGLGACETEIALDESVREPLSGHKFASQGKKALPLSWATQRGVCEDLWL